MMEPITLYEVALFVIICELVGAVFAVLIIKWMSKKKVIPKSCATCNGVDRSRVIWTMPPQYGCLRSPIFITEGREHETVCDEHEENKR